MVSAELIKINIMTKEEMKAKVRSVTLCMLAHPDNEPDSEFADRISDLTEIFEALTIASVDSRRELLSDEPSDEFKQGYKVGWREGYQEGNSD